MHSVGSAVLAAKVTPAQVETLRDIARGQHLTTLALSEPGTGAHFYFPTTALTQVSDDKIRVNGTKSFVTNGGRADSYVVSTTAADPDAPPDEFSCVIIPDGAPGVTWGPKW